MALLDLLLSSHVPVSAFIFIPVESPNSSNGNLEILRIPSKKSAEKENGKSIKGSIYLRKLHRTDQKEILYRKLSGNIRFRATGFFEGGCSSLILGTKTASSAAARLYRP